MSKVLDAVSAATDAQSLRPLIAFIQDELDKNKYKQIDPGFRLVTCDSFCEPNRVLQQKLVKTLDKIETREPHIDHVLSPTYIFSHPDRIDLSILSSIQRICSINILLRKENPVCPNAGTDDDFFSFLLNDNRLGVFIQNLLDRLPGHVWDDVNICGFPFHQLAFRDISTAYKIDPSDSHSLPFQEEIRFATIVSFLTLLGFIIQDKYNKLNIGMSFYSTNLVYKFFCDYSGTLYRFLDVPMFDERLVGESPQSLIRILNTPADIALINSREILRSINALRISQSSTYLACQIITQKIKGRGTHTYSKAKFSKDLDTSSIFNQIKIAKTSGGKIVSLFTSSPDEVAGQVQSYEHYSINLSHLSKPVFSDQTDWICETIRLFGCHHPDSLLVIRFHPRLGSDHRGLAESPVFPPQLKKVQQAMSTFNNIKLVLPSDDVSSYQLGLMSDLILNGWSTIGLDMAILNKRVIYAFMLSPYGGGAYHPVFYGMRPFHDKKDYFREVCASLTCSTQSTRTIDADSSMKAYMAAHLAGCVKVTDENQVFSQLVNPVLFTSYLTGLIANNSHLKVFASKYYRVRGSLRRIVVASIKSDRTRKLATSIRSFLKCLK